MNEKAEVNILKEWKLLAIICMLRLGHKLDLKASRELTVND